MSMIFGGAENRNIRAIVDKLTQSSGAICNESAFPTSMNDMEIENMRDSIRHTMLEMYEGQFDERFDSFLKEDAEQASQIFVNNLREMHEGNLLSENAVPDIRTLTASIAVTMRTPYEATYHRLFNTRTADKWVIEMQDVEPTIAAPEQEEELLIDALSPYAKTKFIDKTETPVTVLTEGVTPGAGCKDLALTPGMDPLLKVGRDVRVTGIKATYKSDSTEVPPQNLIQRRGCTPYFDVKTNRMHIEYDVVDGEHAILDTLHIDAEIDFKKNTLKYLNVSDSDVAEVTKVFFYANVSHEEHLHPITTGAINNFKQFIIPTRPHIEVSMPQETRTDINNTISYFGDNDIITYMTEQIATISSRMEDERLQKCLEADHMFEASFSFLAPDNFAYGNLEWFKREFVPFLDQVALKMKYDYNITDCHFRVAVSPYILRILDTDYTMDKSATEDSKGSGPINYSIGVKTSTATFYLISSQRQPVSELRVLLQPNQFKTAQVRTYDYYRYTSFLTDKIRRSDNTRFEAIVYSERNLPIVFTPLSTKLDVTDMYINQESGARWFKKV